MHTCANRPTKEGEFLILLHYHALTTKDHRFASLEISYRPVTNVNQNNDIKLFIYKLYFMHHGITNCTIIDRTFCD